MTAYASVADALPTERRHRWLCLAVPDMVGFVWSDAMPDEWPGLGYNVTHWQRGEGYAEPRLMMRVDNTRRLANVIVHSGVMVYG